MSTFFWESTQTSLDSVRKHLILKNRFCVSWTLHKSRVEEISWVQVLFQCSIAGDHVLHVILLGVGGITHNPHTLVPLKSHGLDSQRVKKLALKLHAHSVHYAPKLVQTSRSRAFSSPSNSSGEVCWLVCPQFSWSSLTAFFSSGEGAFLPKWPLFLKWCEELFCCLRYSFFLSFFLLFPVKKVHKDGCSGKGHAAHLVYQ